MSHRLAAAIILICLGCTDAPSSGSDVAMAPEGLALPMIFECRGESCSPGTWAACDSLAVVQGPLTPDRVITWLTRNEQFRVQGANTVVLVPGVVRVTRDTQEGFPPYRQLYRAGDTVYVLDSSGEAIFHVWYQGGISSVELFWPWERAGGFEISGEVLQEQESELWLRVETSGGIRGWVLKDSERMLNALGRYMREPGTPPCDAAARNLSLERDTLRR